MRLRVAKKIVKFVRHSPEQTTHPWDRVVRAFRRASDALPTPPEKASEPSVDLSAMKVAELRALAKEQGLTGYSKLKKADLIAALEK